MSETIETLKAKAQAAAASMPMGDAAPSSNPKPGVPGGDRPPGGPVLSDREIKDLAEMGGALISYPYDYGARLYKWDGFKLNEDEKLINGVLAKYFLIYYLPFINPGKLALWGLIIFNGLLITSKFIEYRNVEKGKLTTPTTPAAKEPEKPTSTPDAPPPTEKGPSINENFDEPARGRIAQI